MIYENAIVDVHSHILPRLDDGVQSYEDAKEILTYYKKLGFKKIIATPHNYAGYHTNSNFVIKKTLENLKKYCFENNIDIDLDASSEYFVNNYFLELLDKNEVLPFGEKYLLIELHPLQNNTNIFDVVKLIQDKGFIPVLAHPERYVYFYENREIYYMLVESGVLFQINYISLCEVFLTETIETVKFLIDNNLVSFAGSDLHSIINLQIMEKLANHEYITKLLTSEKLLNKTLL
ncbi:MAG: hypothetical protein N3A01_06545 [Bacteroidales bacterium]|nr:hypothetical protein [Bacteroidales bacterium]